MSGLFVAVVGPSGAGKDSLLRAIAERFAGDKGLQIVKRYVTRASDAHEDHHSLDVVAFEEMARVGRFALTWRAYGLSYGVGSDVDAALAQGVTVACNLSRAAVERARARWPEVAVALVTARPETLALRLAARGREAAEEQRLRLQRAETGLSPDVVIDNDGELDQAAERLYAWLLRRRKEPK